MKQWKCICSNDNPIYRFECKECGTPMPESVMLDVYMEELFSERKILAQLARAKSKVRWEDVGRIMERAKDIYIVILIIWVALWFWGTTFYFSSEIDKGANLYSERADARRRIEIQEAIKCLDEICEMHEVAQGLVYKTAENIVDLKNGTIKRISDIDCEIDVKKQERVTRKINGVKEYVTKWY